MKIVIMKINIRRTNDKAKIPTKGSEGAAGFDLYSIEDTAIWKGHTQLIRTGISIAIPEGYEGQVRSRSGCAKSGLVVANSPGTIDCDYRGEVGVLLHNQGRYNAIIRAGERVAQLVIQAVPSVTLHEVSDLTITPRGSGGFGSTGV